MEDISIAIQEYKKAEYSLVVVKDGKIVATSKDKGVKGILNVYTTQPELLNGASVADKLMGRAVTMICELGNVASIYTPLLSQGGEKILQRSKIDYQAERIVPAIRNRDNTDLCPIEKLTTGTENSEEGVKRIQEFFKSMAK